MHVCVHGVLHGVSLCGSYSSDSTSTDLQEASDLNDERVGVDALDRKPALLPLP